MHQSHLIQVIFMVDGLAKVALLVRKMADQRIQRAPSVFVSTEIVLIRSAQRSAWLMCMISVFALVVITRPSIGRVGMRAQHPFNQCTHRQYVMPFFVFTFTYMAP